MHGNDVSKKNNPGLGCEMQFVRLRPIQPVGLALTRRRGCLLALIAGLIGCGGDSPLGPSDNVALGRIHASTSFTCARGNDLRAMCWGSNDVGQLGNGSISDERSPRVISGDLRFSNLSTKPAGRHVCGVTTSGAAYCWGRNDFGQLGDGSLQARATPTLVSGNLTFSSISAVWRFSCGLTTDGVGYCWGRGEWGQLGDGLATRSLVPVRVAGGHRFLKIEAGSNNLVCGLTTEERILCWGLNRAGALGAPSSVTCTRSDGFQLGCATIPQPISSDERFRDLSTGSSFACGITTSAIVLCWGRNHHGQLGREGEELCPQRGSEIPCSRTPVAVSGGHRFATVATGITHVCGVTLESDAYCWGENSFGQRGNGSLGVSSSIPELVLGGLSFATVSAGDLHSCGETTDGNLYCWGANHRGQLGSGNIDLGLTPVSVVAAVAAR